MTLVDRIKQKCIENKTNFATIEKELNIGNGVIRRWNERNPGIYQVLKVAERLNVSIEWLITGKEAESLNTEEKKLIENYRKADERGKRRIQLTADQEVQEQESSTFKIG